MTQAIHDPSAPEDDEGSIHTFADADTMTFDEEADTDDGSEGAAK